MGDRSGGRAADPVNDSELVDAFLGASRALVGVAVRSLAAAEPEVTLPQYRALVLLDRRGAQRVSDLADMLGVNGSTATRQCDRLERKGLLRRNASDSDRRSVFVSPTDRGRTLVSRVTNSRREQIHRILRAMPPQDRVTLIAALTAFADAAGEAPEQHWSSGWDHPGSAAPH
jgi:DNA-binding MarR family transcriptional regulator